MTNAGINVMPTLTISATIDPNDPLLKRLFWSTASDSEEYHAWRDEFLRTTAAKAAIKELDKLMRYHPTEHDVLLHQVLDACFKASQHKKGDDTFELKRRSESEALSKLLPQQIKAVRELRRFIREHPITANLVMGLRHFRDRNPCTAQP